jgi:predicted methyltransferase
MNVQLRLPVALLAAAGFAISLNTAFAADPVVYADAVAADSRLPGDYERDAGRKPATVLEFFGIEPGDTVLDLFSGGGYYTELLAHVVGPDGHVIAQSNKAYLNFVGDEFKERYANDRLPNVDILMAENNELELAAGSLDAIMLVLSYHDIYHVDVESGWEKIDRDKLLAELYKGLKPGGVFGVVDHVATSGAPPETGDTLHRIDPARVIRDVEAAGFELDGQSDALRNPADDHSKIVFDPAVRGQTDRFILRFRKPE